jgi:hypothetical protein
VEDCASRGRNLESTMRTAIAFPFLNRIKAIFLAASAGHSIGESHLENESQSIGIRLKILVELFQRIFRCHAQNITPILHVVKG